MARFRGEREAFGQPGIEPRWTHGDKQGIGTAYGLGARTWFTIFRGILTEVYYPTVDRAQLRDLQYLVTDGESFFHEEKRDLHSKVERLCRDALAYRVTSSDRLGRYSIVKDIIADPNLPCVLQRTRIEGDRQVLPRLRFYALCAPHLEIGGWHNSGYVVEAAGRWILAAEKRGTWMALAATVPFSRLSCGYVGHSDGWTDLADNLQMDWEFDRARDGNIALTGELDLSETHEFTLGLAFGDGLHNAVTVLLQALGIRFEEQLTHYEEQWDRVAQKKLPLEKASGDGGNCYFASHSLLLAHEDKSYPGALIASLSIPWGEANGDDDMGGYHLVWTRDMVNSSTALLAAGEKQTPLRGLIYLAASQEPDGGFPQNFWINGQPYWSGIQLDEVAFPILLAWRLHRENALEGFDPYPMVLRAAGYLIRNGPATQQERWEEASGYSPSTLAASIAALICAAGFSRALEYEATAQFLEEYSDFLESHVEAWTVTTDGTLVPEIKRHYIRIHPVDVNDPHPDEDPNHGTLIIANKGPGEQREFPAKEIVDAGFLELVRYGVRKPDDPVITNSIRVVDAVLKVETPHGPCWHRYNNDGYGQRDDGGPYKIWGKGRAWPLLTGERGHYELAAGNNVRPYIQAMERFASPTGLLPEQVWDQPDRPEIHMYLGGPTGSARPLMWAHAEYIKLIRSASDGRVFDFVPEVAGRYLGTRKKCKKLEVWKTTRQVDTVERGHTLRIMAPDPFWLRWSRDNWQTVESTHSGATALGISYVDIPITRAQQDPIRFTFFWIEPERWEGRDYQVTVTGKR